MVAFLKSMDSKTWKVFIKGWEHPVGMDKDGKATISLKLEEDRFKDEDEITLGNSKALNVLFNAVDKNMFRIIITCTVANDACEILKTTYEGTSKVRMSRLHLLTTKFENLTMKYDESIQDFHMSILDIPNTSSVLGESMYEEKLVRIII